MMVHTHNPEKDLKTEMGYFDCFCWTNLRRTDRIHGSVSTIMPGAAFPYSHRYYLAQAGLKLSKTQKKRTERENSICLAWGFSSYSYLGGPSTSGNKKQTYEELDLRFAKKIPAWRFKSTYQFASSESRLLLY
jgi:hypothetical protein